MTDASTDTKSRRPEASVERDRTVLTLLAERDYNRHELDDVLGTTWRVTYGALTRLRARDLVTLKRTGTRTPVWGLTKAGVKASEAVAGSPEPVEETEDEVSAEETGFQTVPA